MVPRTVVVLAPVYDFLRWSFDVFTGVALQDGGASWCKLPRADVAAVPRFMVAVSRRETWLSRCAHDSDIISMYGVAQIGSVQRSGLLQSFVCERLRTAYELLNLCRVR